MSVTWTHQMSSRKALALIVVVYILVALGTLAFALAFRSRIGLWQARLVMDGTQQDEIAMAVCAQARRLLAMDDPNVDSYAEGWSVWRALEIPPGLNDVGQAPWEVRWRLEDESAKINVNLVPSDVLSRIEGLDDAVVGSILDWIDKDDIPNPGGAETEYYASLTPRYACKNGPLETLEELMFIKGVTTELYFGTGQEEQFDVFEDASVEQIDATNDSAAGDFMGLGNMLTVYGDGRINLNTALPAVLRAIPFLSDAAISEILSRQRSLSRTFTTQQDIQSNEAFSVTDKIILQQVARFNSNHFQLHVKIRPQGIPSICEYTAILEREEETVHILNWQRRLPRMRQDDLHEAVNSYWSTGAVN